MKKVLLISTQSCYPLFSGGALAQYYFIDGLKDEVEFVLCPLVTNDAIMNNVSLLRQRQPNLKVYVCDVRPQTAKKTFVQKLKGWLNPFFSKKKKFDSPMESDDFLDPYFSRVDHVFYASWLSLIQDVITKEHIEVVQYDFYETIDIVYALPKHVKKIFVEHEVRFKRLKLAAETSNVSEVYKRNLIRKTEAYERMCAAEADVVVVFNEDDAELLRPSCKQVVVSPFAIPDEDVYNIVQAGEYDKLLFVGGEGHNPNSVGLTWFLDNVYIPNLQRIDYPIYIVGVWSESYKSKYANYDKIRFTGKVPSIAPWFIHAVFVNPILSGAGLRTKVLHAMVNGVPVMSTRFGAEGCYTEAEKDHLILFDNAEEFLDGMKDKVMLSIGLAGKQYYQNHFNKANLLNIRKKMYM